MEGEWGDEALILELRVAHCLAEGVSDGKTASADHVTSPLMELELKADDDIPWHTQLRMSIALASRDGSTSYMLTQQEVRVPDKGLVIQVTKS
eukprot:3173098-Amphidinium_carterae.1